MHTVLPLSTETGKLGIMHLKRFWYKAKGAAVSNDLPAKEGELDKTVLFALGIGLEQGLKQIFRTNTFEEFEDWILSIAGQPFTNTVKRFNSIIMREPAAQSKITRVFTDDEMRFFHQNGYVILKNAISVSQCKDVVDALCDLTGIDEHNPATWYNAHSARQAIMVQLFQHPALQKARDDQRIRHAFEQLWGRTDIWATVDRVGFNPPETDAHPYNGDRLHWDVSLQQPIPFGLQGLIYLTDTAANQGAFTLVPGFQHRVADWLRSLPPGTDPRRQDLNALGSKPIVANAGDLVIWQHALPHGASPNRSSKPRFVQYLTYNPADLFHHPNWI